MTEKETLVNIEFKVGQTYRCFSPCDHNCTWDYTVAARTAKTIVLLTAEHPGRRRESFRCKIKVWEGVETVNPQGRHSFAPVLTAEKLVLVTA
jgi:hypothetical protein